MTTVKKPAMESPRLIPPCGMGGPSVPAGGGTANSKKLLRRQTENRWHLPCYWLPVASAPYLFFVLSFQIERIKKLLGVP
jgi:hypothetical protein